MSLIGMFDSGVGGLTVLHAVEKQLPNHNFIYFGDTGRCPYGPKGDATIIRYSIENSIFLLEHKVELIIVACHTATSLALDKLQSTFHVPIIGVVEPSVEKAATITTHGRIGVIGTRATIQSGIYQKKLKEKICNAHIAACACPLFVPLVEDDFPDEKVVAQVVAHYL
ncbi:MAG TPA: glutamate racemase, partial [Chlamydiales bacterium]|nr:glutamate racemase [Chlamydiales bacterium]